jgi:hypothetical protein
MLYAAFLQAHGASVRGGQYKDPRERWEVFSLGTPPRLLTYAAAPSHLRRRAFSNLL